MSIRKVLEEREAQWLAPWAARSAEHGERARPIPPDDLRTDFQRDRDRILHAKAFRRLKHKTQCFLTPEGDHFRTRLTHTLEVAQIARTLARSLRLNEDLAEAVALGHDLGHTPYGHMGERILDRLMPEGFRHREQSLRVVEVLERGGQGLNLTAAVRDGILRHSGETPPSTLEGQCVARADRVAYINHDIDDAVRAGVLAERDLPRDITALLGETHGARIDSMIRDIVLESADGQSVRMSAEVGEATMALRDFLFERVYMRREVLAEEEKADRLLDALFHYALEHPAMIPEDYFVRGYQEGMPRAVCDFIAGMTDRYAMQCFARYFLPAPFAQGLTV
ncbi:MAG: deoxyguanosinetriphosphate triphosphohydrolase [Firmicutes bacterium]|nr:deoxyguanosinetriphosphate triphosphohydrolase [Bacillota bacterium]